MGQVYMCIDLKSFYAYVECVARGYDPFKVPLVVADSTRGDGAITLAISPALKEMGVKNRCHMRYTLYRSLAQVTKWVRLKFAAMNLKKLAIHLRKEHQPPLDYTIFIHFSLHDLVFA